jgi:lipopolysaccharide/colanic/teichoic acid biosynthesis glycosyltransferase
VDCDRCVVNEAGELPRSLLDSAARDRDAQRFSTLGKRVFDLVVGGLGLILLLPMLLALAVVIRVTSPGPAFFRQERVGRDRRSFVMWKLRTMQQDNDDDVHRSFVAGLRNDVPSDHIDDRAIYKLTHDPRVTPVGRWLRRTSLDELPQLINVVRGSMSLVGPRPALPWEIDLFEDLPRYVDRFHVKPGVTGLWQVSGRGTLTIRQAVALDARYADSRSFVLDLHILLRTIPAVLNGRGAF